MRLWRFAVTERVRLGSELVYAIVSRLCAPSTQWHALRVRLRGRLDTANGERKCSDARALHEGAPRNVVHGVLPERRVAAPRYRRSVAPRDGRDGRRVLE